MIDKIRCKNKLAGDIPLHAKPLGPAMAIITSSLMA